MSARQTILSTAVSLLPFLLAEPSAASEPHFLIGATVGFDSPSTGEAFPVGEVVGRYFPSPTAPVEVAASYRSFTYENLRGRSGEEYTLTQKPLLLGIRGVLGPNRFIRVLVGGGLHVSPSRLSYSSYVYSYSPSAGGYVTKTGSLSKVVVGGYLGLDTEMRLGQSARLLSGIRYVFNPISPPFSTEESQSYLRLFVGGGAHF